MLAAAIAIAPAGCGDSDASETEKDIAALVKSNTGAQRDIECPDGLDADKGKRFTCKTRIDGQAFDIGVEFVGDGKFKITSFRPAR